MNVIEIYRALTKRVAGILVTDPLEDCSLAVPLYAHLDFLGDPVLRKATFALLIVLTISAFVTLPYIAAGETVLYGFCPSGTCSDGMWPSSTLVFDSAGNLYGTTSWGGEGWCSNRGCGVVFQLVPDTNGGWTENVLYTFCPEANCPDGALPQGGVILDSAGNLYGATWGFEGSNVYELTRGANGQWTMKVLYSFKPEQGRYPTASLTFDASGNLYGTMFGGGKNADSCAGSGGCGVVFELSPGANGTWAEKDLHKFCSAPNCTDGAAPEGNLILDSEGDVYGTTRLGGGPNPDCGSYGCGIVYELTPNTDGKWTERVLHRFDSSGYSPYAGLTFDSDGNIFGTTFSGGGGTWKVCGGTGCGTVFELTPVGNGKWRQKIIMDWGELPGRPPLKPLSNLVFDSAGNLYGTSDAGGVDPHAGAVFRLRREANGTWKDEVLYSFLGLTRHDGQNPVAAVVPDAAGNVYGTTEYGGPYEMGWCGYNDAGCGTVFEINANDHDISDSLR
jgi:hypothetical protein